MNKNISHIIGFCTFEPLIIVNSLFMLQRIQTLYLFLVFLAAALMLFFPLVEFISGSITIYLKVFSIEHSEGIDGLPNPSVIGFLVAALGVISMGSIFQFQNRRFQMKINAVALLVNFGLLVAIFLVSDKIAANDLVNDKPDYLFGAYLPVVSVLFLILANRSIRKDEALVKQSERIR